MEDSPQTLEEFVDALPGPIVVTGASGFIGAHLMALLTKRRSDVFGFVREDSSTWRLDSLMQFQIERTPNFSGMMDSLERVGAKTIFNLAAHGAYSSQTDRERILATNLELVVRLANWATDHSCTLVQAGSSSEYGLNSRAPSESDARPMPNSLYAISKLGATLWLEHSVRVSQLNAVTLRLYSVYGPLEEPTRLVPTLIREGLRGNLPPFSGASISRDYVYIDDVLEAFIKAAYFAPSSARGLTINVCAGTELTMMDVARIAKQEFLLTEEPRFGEFSRHWDLDSWFGNPSLAAEKIQWRAQTTFQDGLHRTREFYERPESMQLLSPERRELRKEEPQHPKKCVSVVVACYRDAQAIPFMYRRVKESLESAGYEFELILVNDSSPDNTLEVLESVSLHDNRVVGITHSRNFGSQAAFLSGMKVAHGDFVALLDGDLQDPPELLPQMLSVLMEGYDVVNGRRVGRDAPRAMQVSYKLFYRLFAKLSPFTVPKDAGDFSVMTRSVAHVISSMPERDLFIRAQRAYVGFRQTGVDYVRPERMFGTSTNNLRKNVGWAMRGVLAVSRAPLTALSIFGVAMFVIALVLIVAQVLTRIFWPDIAPEGLATISILILGMGAINILGIAVLGEYVGRILDETKRRPRFVRRLLTQSGETRVDVDSVGD